MPSSQQPGASLPDPAGAGSLDDLVERLRLLKVWAGDPSYDTITGRVNAAWTAAGRPASELARRSTVASCFTPGRRRFNTDLVVAVVEALHPDVGYVNQWRQTLGEATAQVRVQDTLPPDLAGFAGRGAELDRLHEAMRAGDTVVLSALEGMGGVGKTRLAVHAGHRLMAAKAAERVLFVNLRGFDPAEPPAEPAAVLDGFLRLLGMPGHQIPHDLTARADAFREHVATAPTLVILDNAATAEQVRPLVADVAGCLTLITSRRSLAELKPATQLTVDVFTPAEALDFLTLAVGAVDRDAAARIAQRCGYLPLALNLIAAHIRNTPGWTLADHADRLDERHRQRRLDSEVEIALDLSYQRLPAGHQRLLRLAALHPGTDFDAYAAAALTESDPFDAEAWLDDLCADHLLMQAGPGRYTFHDLVRAHAITRAHDEEPPSGRRAALTRLFDHYLTTAAAAMDAIYPGESQRRRPPIPPAATPAPDLADPEQALSWLLAERPTLVAVTVHTATHGWPRHATRLAITMSRYLSTGHHGDSRTIYEHAYRAARLNDDLTEQAETLRALGVAHLLQGLRDVAVDHFERSFELCGQTGDLVGQARALINLSMAAKQSGRYPAAIEHLQQALSRYLRAGDRYGEATALTALGVALQQSGRHDEAIDYLQRSLAIARESGVESNVAYSLNGLGETEVRSGRYEAARAHLQEALTLYRQFGNRTGEANVLDGLGTLHARLGDFDRATDFYQQALALFREVGDRHVETWVLNGLGEAALAAGRPADALAHHTEACAIATGIGVRNQEAAAHAGLGHTHLALGDPGLAREHYRRALAVYTELGLPEADQIRAGLQTLIDTQVEQ
ncbi:tetratricopeptide repeat protein [Actinoplanes sp. NPDC026619]|uniref:tetratricopeptide repeat protein n=1 Tax=Actinoplanes sp. NPDC026619 TaxID=3155798 RepID=UPI0033E834CA